MPHTILFVDDEKPILSSLAFSFEEDYDVLTAQNAEEALNFVKTQRIAVIVSDHRMPGMQGAELLSRVKEISPMTMRILLTGYADIEAIMASINAGSVFRFVNKPWDIEKLRATVKLACHIYEQMQALAGHPIFLEEKPSARAEKKAVLFIDTPNNLAALRELFEHDYFVYTTDSFERALEIVQQREIAALTTEAVLNGEESTPFIAALRDLKPNVAVIMLTGSKDAALAMRLINEGRIFRYLVKPFTRQILRETLSVAIEQYSSPIALDTVARHLEHKTIFNGDTPSVQTQRLADVIQRVNAKLSRIGTY